MDAMEELPRSRGRRLQEAAQRAGRPGTSTEMLESFMKSSLAADEAILQQLSSQGPGEAATGAVKMTVPSLPRVSAEPQSLRAWRQQRSQAVPTSNNSSIETKELKKLRTSLHELQGEVQQLQDSLQEEAKEFAHGVTRIREALDFRSETRPSERVEKPKEHTPELVPVTKCTEKVGGSASAMQPLSKALLQSLCRGEDPEPSSTLALSQVGQLILEWLPPSSTLWFRSVCCKVTLALHTREGRRIWPHLALHAQCFCEVPWSGVSPNHVHSLSVYGATDEVVEAARSQLEVALAAPTRVQLLRFRCSARGSEAAIEKRNKYGDSMGLGDSGAAFLIAAAKKQVWWSSLSSLDFAWNHLCVSALGTLEHSWPSTLRSLCLDWNGIGPEGAMLLARALARPNLLGSLDLRSNPLKDEGVLCICKALSACPLNWLGLGETMLTDHGAELASKTLQGHPFLKGIDISENSITDAACDFLAQFVQKTPRLQQLYLRGYLFEPTRISDIGGEVLARSVSCKDGFELELDYQQVGCKTAAALARNSLWSRVSLFNTNVSTMGALGLANSFRNGVALGAEQKWLNVAQCRIAPSAIKLLRSVGFLRLDSHGQRPR